MARPVILGNGSLTIGLNEHGLVHDFYYPYVGLDNLTTARSVHHKIGVWVNGAFSWVDDGSWKTTVTFESDALISNVSLVNDQLGVELTLHDFVDTIHTIFIRDIQIKNNRGDEADIRLFMHQVFEISRGGRADTALFVPEEHYILDYKGRCCLLIYAQDEFGVPFDQFAVGSYGIEGKEGTFRDAEDGELSGSAVEHGGVDSVIRMSFKVAPGKTIGAEYWVVAGDSQAVLERTHKQLLKDTIEHRQAKVRAWWKEWFAPATDKLEAIDDNYLDIFKKSLLVIKAHCDRRGGIIASCDSSIYNYGRDYYSYVWPRDGAYAVWPLIRIGIFDEAKKFFLFCRDTATEEGYMMHKYQPDRAIGSTWHPLLHGRHSELAIQEDETACIIFMLGEYLDYSKDFDFCENIFETYVKAAADFLVRFVDDQTGLPHASYDLWEEKFLTSTYSTAITYKALKVAARLAHEFGYAEGQHNWEHAATELLKNNSAFWNEERQMYRKGFLLQEDNTLQFDNVLDVSSMYAMFMYEFETDKPRLKAALSTLENELLNSAPSGGAPRYEYDHYFAVDPAYKGNPWIVTTLWIAQFYVRIGMNEAALHLVDWAIERALPSGVLAEQFNPSDGSALSVTPLVWSHAELANTLLDLHGTE